MPISPFATAINCIDGRVQLPVIEWLQTNFPIQFVDMITEPGPIKILLNGTDQQLENIKSKISISSIAHNSSILAIVGHHDCAGNPIPKVSKWAQIEKAVELIKTWKLSFHILGPYVNENWEIEVVI